MSARDEFACIPSAMVFFRYQLECIWLFCWSAKIDGCFGNGIFIGCQHELVTFRGQALGMSLGAHKVEHLNMKKSQWALHCSRRYSVSKFLPGI